MAASQHREVARERESQRERQDERGGESEEGERREGGGDGGGTEVVRGMDKREERTATVAERARFTSPTVNPITGTKAQTYKHKRCYCTP